MFKLLRRIIKLLGENHKVKIVVEAFVLLIIVFIVYYTGTSYVHRYTEDDIVNANDVIRVSTDGSISVEFKALSNELHSFSVGVTDVEEETCFDLYYCVYDPANDIVIKMEKIEGYTVTDNGQIKFDFKYDPIKPMRLKKGNVYDLNIRMYYKSGQRDIGLYATDDTELHTVQKFYVDGEQKQQFLCTKLVFDNRIGRLIEIVLLVVVIILLCCLSFEKRNNENKESFIDAVTAILILYLLYYAAIKLTKMSFYTSDDSSIQATLSGGITGGFYPYHHFISTLIGYPIGKLFEYIPGFSWWYIYSQIIQLIGLFLVHFSCLRMSSSYNKRRYPAVFGLLTIDVVMGINIVGGVAFSVVPAVLGTGIVVYNIAVANRAIQVPKWFIIMLNSAGLLLCEAHRIDSAKVVLIFWIVSIGYTMFCCERTRKKRILTFAGAVAFGIISLLFVAYFNKNISTRINGREFVDFYDARVAWIDYPHKSYSEAPEVYEKVGWTKNEALMAERWIFIGEHVDTESLRKLAKLSREGKISEKFKENLRLFWEDVGDKNNVKVIVFLVIVSVISFSGMIKLERFNESKDEWLKCICIALSIAMVIYLIYIGRPLHRVVWISVFPCIATEFLISQKNRNISAGKLYACLLMAVLLWTMPDEYINANMEKKSNNPLLMQEAGKTDMYVQNHPDIFFVNIGGRVYHPNTAYLTHAMWGSREIKEKYELNGIGKIDGEMFRKENVRFVYGLEKRDKEDNWNEKMGFESLYSYLEENYGCTGWEIEDRISDNSYVYRFLFD